MANAITACDEQVNCAKAKYEQSEKDKKTKEKAAEDKKGIDAQVETAEDNYKDTLKKVNSAKTDAATAENSVKNWKKQLEGFSRYVLSGFFHRIVEQANVHLETITDGEYCLVPKETGDGRANIGLELKVLNTITNMERDTATLSGGQLLKHLYLLLLAFLM